MKREFNRIAIWAPVLAAALLAGCTKEQIDKPGDPREIRVYAGMSDISATRAVSDASTGLTGAAFVVVEGGATAPSSFAGGAFYTGNVAATSGKVSFTSTSVPTYNLSDANAWFVAYAPGGALTADAIEWTIDGKTDIMITNTAWDAGKYSAPATTGLNFNHRLAQVEVVCQGENGAAASVTEATWGKITKIEFVGAPDKMKYNLSATPAVSVSGSADLSLLADYDGAVLGETQIPAYGNTTSTAVAMLAPVSATATESFMLKVTTSGAAATPTKPIRVEIPVSLDGSRAEMSAGLNHKVTLTFKAQLNEITATATIAEWGAPVDEDVDMDFYFPNLFYGDADNNGDNITSLQGFTINSYNDYTYSSNGPRYTTDAAAYAGEPGYKTLQVALAFEKNAAGDLRMNSWGDAWDACKNKTDDGGGWRLPRLSELELMYNNRASLARHPWFEPFDSQPWLWAGTEYDNDYAWCVGFSAGSADRVNREYKALGSVGARCVREVPLTLEVDQNGILTLGGKMLFFQFGSLVGFTQEGAWGADKVLFNPTAKPNSDFANYTSIPVYSYNASIMNISASAYHNGTNIKSGKGDPCMLVGLSAKQIRSMTTAELDSYNSGWRLPTVAENKTFTGQSSGISYSAHWTDSDPRYDNWYYSTGSAGGYFPKGQEDQKLNYLPAAGYRDGYSFGAPSGIGTGGYYWTSDVIDNTYGYYAGFDSGSVGAEDGSGYTTGFGARCVRQ